MGLDNVVKIALALTLAAALTGQLPRGPMKLGRLR